MSTSETMQIAVYALLLFCFLVLVKLLFRGDTVDRTLQKTFGGIAVLSCALASQNMWIIWTSLFIGGLIIASEDFMKFLAAIMRTNGDKIPETINAFQTQRNSRDDIETKVAKEIQEINELEITSRDAEPEVNEGKREDETTEDEENVSLLGQDYKNLLPQIEDVALVKLEKSLGKSIERQSHLVGLGFRFDGIIIDNDQKQLRLFEVKAFPKLPRNKHGKVMAFTLVNSLSKSFSPVISDIANYLKDKSGKAGWQHTLTIVLVLNTKSEFVKLRRRIEDLKPTLSQLGSSANLEVNFVFYNLKNMNLELAD
jgi:hypothetical protein